MATSSTTGAQSAGPTPFGKIRVVVEGQRVTVWSDGGKGCLVTEKGRKEILPNTQMTYT